MQISTDLIIQFNVFTVCSQQNIRTNACEQLATDSFPPPLPQHDCLL